MQVNKDSHIINPRSKSFQIPWGLHSSKWVRTAVVKKGEDGPYCCSCYYAFLGSTRPTLIFRSQAAVLQLVCSDARPLAEGCFTGTLFSSPSWQLVRRGSCWCMSFSEWNCSFQLSWVTPGAKTVPPGSIKLLTLTWFLSLSNKFLRTDGGLEHSLCLSCLLSTLSPYQQP